MKGIFITIFLTSSFQFVLAQTKFPIFESQQDSADHATLSRMINDEFMKGEHVNGKKIDSMMMARTSHREKDTRLSIPFHSFLYFE